MHRNWRAMRLLVGYRVETILMTFQDGGFRKVSPGLVVVTTRPLRATDRGPPANAARGNRGMAKIPRRRVLYVLVTLPGGLA